jgi:hypothetical protein
VPLGIEVFALAGLFVGDGVTLWAVGILLIGVPIVFLVAAGALAAEGVGRYAALAGALVPVSAVLNAIFLLSLCQAEFANNHGGTLP